MPWTGWPDPVPTGTKNYQVTVTGKDVVQAGLIAAFTPQARTLALKAALRELKKFMAIAPNTPAVKGGTAVVVFQNPPYYRKRLVKKIDPTTLVLLRLFYRLYLNVKAKG